MMAYTGYKVSIYFIYFVVSLFVRFISLEEKEITAHLDGIFIG